jgi:hypothetical protein
MFLNTLFLGTCNLWSYLKIRDNMNHVKQLAIQELYTKFNSFLVRNFCFHDDETQ